MLLLLLLGFAGCVGPYSQAAKDDAQRECAAPAELFEMVEAFAQQYCDQLEVCDPGALCDPPEVAPDTGPCDYDDPVGTDCLCEEWTCDGITVIAPEACRSICG
jgi:hypothetical protein